MTYRPVQFDEKTVMGSVNYDHDLLLSSLKVINLGGVALFPRESLILSKAAYSST